MELVKFELHTAFPIPLWRFVFITPISDYIKNKKPREREREREEILVHQVSLEINIVQRITIIY